MDVELSLCNFDTLFSKNLPHILEKIFLFLDYKSFKICQMVNSEWREFLKSRRLMSLAKCVFKVGILDDEIELHTAVMQDNTDNIKILLSMGFVDVNCRKSIYNNFTPLHLASYKGNKESVKILLKSGADPNLHDCWRNTPLQIANHYGHEEVVELLVDGGADFDNFNLCNTALFFLLWTQVAMTVERRLRVLSLRGQLQSGEKINKLTVEKS